MDEHTGDVVACELTSKGARDASRVASLVGRIERSIASATADAAYDTGDVRDRTGQTVRGAACGVTIGSRGRLDHRRALFQRASTSIRNVGGAS